MLLVEERIGICFSTSISYSSNHTVFECYLWSYVSVATGVGSLGRRYFCFLRFVCICLLFELLKRPLPSRQKQRVDLSNLKKNAMYI